MNGDNLIVGRGAYSPDYCSPKGGAVSLTPMSAALPEWMTQVPPAPGRKGDYIQTHTGVLFYPADARPEWMTQVPPAPGRKGDYIQTHTGVLFYPADARPEEINIEDIAHALAHTCRYGGHSPSFYSVAQHSVMCAEQALKTCPEFALTTLMHDASEAYLVDVPRPIKKMLGGYREMEAGLEQVISAKYGLVFPLPAEVKTIDNRMLATEGKCFFDQFPNKWWENGEYGFALFDDIVKQDIWFWQPHEAKDRFMEMFHALVA
jgi:hypothetical protein